MLHGAQVRDLSHVVALFCLRSLSSACVAGVPAIGSGSGAGSGLSQLSLVAIDRAGDSEKSTGGSMEASFPLQWDTLTAQLEVVELADARLGTVLALSMHNGESSRASI